MLRRALHLRLALLAFMAAMLLVVMPTITPVLAPSDAAHAAMRMDANADAATAHSPGDMPGRRDHRDHDGAACAYCPLLAGLVQWAPTPPWHGALPPAATMHATLAAAPASRLQRDTLGARGPPALHIA